MRFRFDENVREIVAGAAILFAIVTLAFAPFTYGDRTIMSSAAEVAGLYSGGGAPNLYPRIILKGLDPGAAAWQTEPELFLEHQEVTSERVFPLWNPYVAFGQPLAANMISQPFYPLTWLVDANPSARAYNWFVVLRFFVGALFAFLFLRLFVRFVAALAGGVAFAFTGYFILYYNIAHLSVEVLIPALLWAMELLARRRGPGSVVRLALVLAIVVFGGMPESALLAFTFAYAYFIVRVATDSEQRVAWLDAAAKLIGASILGVGMSACLLLPFAEFIKLSVNQHEARLIGAVMGLQNDGFTFQYIAPYLMPLIYGPPWSNIFSGFTGWTTVRGWFGITQLYLALVTLAGLAFEFRFRKKRAWSPVLFFAAVALFVLLKRTGNPLVEWIGMLPGFSLITFPKYEEPILGCCVACLAAFGIERMAAGKIRALDAWIATLVPLALLTAVAAHDRTAFLALTAHQTFYLAALTGGLLILCAIAGLTWASSSIKWRQFSAQFAVLGFALIVLESVGSYLIPMWYVVDGEPPLSRSPIVGAPYVRFLAAETAQNHARFFGEDALLYPEWSSAFGISDVRDINALYDFHYPAFLHAFLPSGPGSELIDRFTGLKQLDFKAPLERRFLQLSSVRYVGAVHRLGGDPSLLSRALAGRPNDVTPMLRLGTYSINGTRRDAVFMHAPRLKYPVPAVVPRNAKKLLFSIAMDPGVWANPATVCGDGVNFSVAVRDAQGHVTLVAHAYIDPKHNVSDRKWFDRSVPIGRWAGQPVQLLFSTLPGPSGNNCADWAIWSNVDFDVRSVRAEESPFKVVFSDSDLLIYRYRDALPRLAIYTAAVRAKNDDQALHLLAARTFDPWREAVVTDGPDGSTALPLSGAVAGRVEAGVIDRYSSQTVTGTVDTHSTALVVLNDTNYPGWTASVDGRDVKILTANYMFRGIIVPAGHHAVEFRYRPRSFQIGLWVSILAFIIAAGYVFIGLRGLRSKRRIAQNG